MGEALEEALAEVFHILEIGFTDFTEEEAFEAGDALAIVGADLGKQPVGFAAAASAAEADGLGASGQVAEASGGTGGELAGLEEDAGLNEVEQLVPGTTVLQAELEEVFQLLLLGRSEGWGQGSHIDVCGLSVTTEPGEEGFEGWWFDTI